MAREGGMETSQGARLIIEHMRYRIHEKRLTLFERVYEKAGEALGSSIHCLRYGFLIARKIPTATFCESSGILKKDT